MVYLSDGDARTLAQWVLGVVDVYRTHAGADGVRAAACPGCYAQSSALSM